MSRSPSRSRSRSRSRSLLHNKPSRSPSPQESGPRVIVISGLTKNVTRGHLEEIFGVYGRVTGADVPVFKICMFTPFPSPDIRY
jgi:RNA-binding protein with serine-rich domain 1